jgi:hypothetical protein
MDESSQGVPEWRREVDLDGVKVALTELLPLLRAVAATVSSMLIKVVDGERTEGRNPRSFTVVISSANDESGPIRYDDADLGRADLRSVHGFDANQRRRASDLECKQLLSMLSPKPPTFPPSLPLSPPASGR